MWVFLWEGEFRNNSPNKDVVNFLLSAPQEYDYVFDVDIEEGKAPLKLPYNISDDPWHVAQKFIHDKNLSQIYLEQVANFIQDNTKGVTLGGPPAPSSSDPFTGIWKFFCPSPLKALIPHFPKQFFNFTTLRSTYRKYPT